MVLALLVAQTVLLGRHYVSLTTAEDPSVRVIAGGRTLWQGVPREYNPWKLAGGDIDGNGMPDFAVGLLKSTHLYPHAHRTVFFYEIRGGEVVPKWRGSSLGRPLVDFAYASLARGPRLVALQTYLDGSFGLFVWRWYHFGFRLERQTGNWKSAELREIDGDAAEMVVNGRPFRATL